MDTALHNHRAHGPWALARLPSIRPHRPSKLRLAASAAGLGEPECRVHIRSEDSQEMVPAYSPGRKEVGLVAVTGMSLHSSTQIFQSD
jgi:hypothetical protein